MGTIKKKLLLSKGCEEFCDRIKRTIDAEHVLRFGKKNDSSQNLLDNTINITRNDTKNFDNVGTLRSTEYSSPHPNSPIKRMGTLD